MWFPMVGFTKYEINDVDGSVRNKRSKKEIKRYVLDGNVYAELTNDQKQKVIINVNRLMAAMNIIR